MFVWQQWHDEHLQRIEKTLLLSTPSGFKSVSRLEEAMAYAVGAGGKRIRPLLVYSTYYLGSDFPNNQQNILAVDKAGAALELIHTYSLVHDDLPSMDNDDLRRGKPTTHKAYDEATALLVGDAMQAQAFGLLSSLEISSDISLELIRELALSAGAHGMCGGQAIDLASVGKWLKQEDLVLMHRLKTGALLRSAIRFGAILGGLSAPNRSILDQIAQDIGLGFQVTDDILDATQDSSTLGKTAGKDEEDHKPTFVTLMGLEKSKLYAQELLERSLLALNYWGSEADPLREITRWAFTRNF